MAIFQSMAPARRAAEAAVEAGGQRHRPRDQHDLEAEDRQAPHRYVPIEDLHLVGSLECGLRMADGLGLAANPSAIAIRNPQSAWPQCLVAS